MLSQILQQKNKKQKILEDVNQLFDKKAPQIKEYQEQEQQQIEDKIIVENNKKKQKKEKQEKEDQKVQIDTIQNIENEISPEQQERRNKTIFVGNINLLSKKKKILKHFTQYGEIEKMWIRSVQVEESKLPQKAKVILKQVIINQQKLQKIKIYLLLKIYQSIYEQFKEDGTYNCYILYKNEESVKKSLESNGLVMDQNHLRVDLAFDKQSDYNFTLFVGNLPFTIKDEEMYKFFEKCGKISYIRVIRDPKTFYGKGIGYVSFCDKEAYSKALLLNQSFLGDRQLRIKKAVPLKRLQKKQLKSQKVKKVLNPAEMRLRKKQQEGKQGHQKQNKKSKETGVKSKKIKKTKQNIKPQKTDKNIFSQ